MAVLAQQRPAAPVPLGAVAAILDAFVTHDVVMLPDPHGRQQMQGFVLSVIRDRRFAGLAQDVVVEGGSARYQDIVDKFVRGDAVDEQALRRAWDDTTVPNAIGPETEELVRAVRQVNSAAPAERQLRVLLGDPPIDWDNITSRDDLFRWVELRDTYPADLIRRQVLERGRKALVLYGQMHAQRRQALSNYDMSARQSQTVASLLVADNNTRVFNVWAFFDSEFVPDGVSSWPVPSLAVTKGTSLGATDFSSFTRIPNRFAMQNGRLAPVPRDQWLPFRMEDQFGAVLYIADPADITMTPMPPALCADSGFIEARLRRYALAGLPPPEAERLRAACGRSR
jgi:hypothetical protein